MKQKMNECNIFLMIWKHIWKIPIKYTIEPHILSDLSCVLTAHVPFKWAFVKIHWHLRNTARGIVNQEKYPMDRAEYCSSFDQWDEEIWRINQPMEQILTSKTCTIVSSWVIIVRYDGLILRLASAWAKIGTRARVLAS